MKIAHCTWEALHSIAVGGVAVHVTELAAAQQRAGHEAHVFARMRWANDVQYEVIHGVHYHRVPYAGSANFVDDINNMCRAFVDAVFKTEDYMGSPFAIVHAHDWMASNAMVWIKQGRGRKGILTMHSTEYGRCGNNFYGGASGRIRDHERHGTFVADKVIAVSNALKGEVCWMYNVPDGKATVAFNGISCDAFNGFLDPGTVKAQYHMGPLDPTALFVGRMTTQKGPDLFIEAIPYVLKFHPTAKFVLTGDGDMKGSVERRAHQIGVAHACRFYGVLPRQQLIDLYKSVDCVVVPSRNEPFGIVVLEGWAAGKPVVGTNHGGPAELIWDDVTGYRIWPTPESIAWGIGTIFSNFEHARWMGRNGRLAAETTFSWDTIAEQTIAIYNS